MLDVQLLRLADVRQDERFLARWAALEREAVEPNPFFAPQMVVPASHTLAKGRDVQLLVAETAERLLFLLPVTGMGGPRLGALPGIRSWTHGYCFLGMPLVSSREDPERIWMAVLDELCYDLPTAMLAVQLQPTDGPVAAAMRQAGGRALGLLQSPVSWRAFVHRRPEPTYTTEWLARKHRANFARRRRELGRRLGAELRVVDRAASDPHAAIEEFLQLEASGWKGRSGTALLRRPGHARFFRETCRAFASQGRLMLLSLQAGSRVVAQSTALVGGDGLFGFKKTYDERLARWSPGTLLDLEVLAWFHQRTDLAWLDTCSSVDNQGASQVFRDRRPIGAMLLPTSRLGSAAATLLPVAFRAHAYLRATRAGRATPRQRQLDQRP